MEIPNEVRFCRYCGESISFAGPSWAHDKTGHRRCALPPLAEPPDALSGVVIEAFERENVRRRNRWKPRSEPLSPLVYGLIGRAFYSHISDVRLVENICESPMEELFAITMIMNAGLRYQSSQRLWLSTNGDKPIKMEAQKPIAGHRADFVFCDWLVVEIDGYDFHNRDQAQASSDRRRDRDLYRAGYVTFRFTGSDIYNTPFECANEVEEICRRERISL